MTLEATLENLVSDSVFEGEIQGSPVTKAFIRANGKIRELFTSVSPSPLIRDGSFFLVYATDRISAYEFVFGFPIPGLGMIRNVMTAFWKRRAERAGIPTDLVAYSRVVDEYLPEKFRHSKDLWKHLQVVKKAEMCRYELIWRFYLLGSMWRAYQALCKKFKEEQGRDLAFDEHVTVLGHKLHGGLFEGYKFPEPLFTPTTKAKVGHDKPVSIETVVRKYGWELVDASKRVVMFLANEHSREGRLELLDVKVEMGWDSRAKQWLFCDEFSPDSARFCTAEDAVKLAYGEKVPFLDKEYFRITFAASVNDGVLGILDPANGSHKGYAKKLSCPPEIIGEVIRRYHRTFELSTGFTLEECLNQFFNI